MNTFTKFDIINDNELLDVQGGGVFLIAAGFMAVPFILGSIAGGADEYARKKGHR